jgi:mannosyl-3-phosphoglycerate phosphatase
VTTPRERPRLPASRRPRAAWPRLALFSDVDGTLLGERGTLAVSAARLAAVAHRIDIILASSRTIAEMLPIQAALGLVAPMVAENGAVVAVPDGWRGVRTGVRRVIAGDVLRVIALGEPAHRIRRVVQRVAKREGMPIVDQRDTLPDRGRAIARTHSVLVRDPRRSDPAWWSFRSALEAEGLAPSRSGRWLTITNGADKGDGVRAILALAECAGAGYVRPAAIGNEENDVELLRAATRRFVIRNPRRGHDPLLASLPKARLLTRVGIAGWREALAHLIEAPRRS